MNAIYNDAFTDLYEQVKEFSPRCAKLLLKLKTQSDAQTAYYGAFILICIQSKAETTGFSISRELDKQNLESFIFYEHSKENTVALDLLNEILTCYRYNFLASQD